MYLQDLILVRLVAWAVLEAPVLKLRLDVLWDPTFNTHGVHSSNIFR